MQLLDGNKIAATIKQEVICAVKELREKHSIIPGLAVIIVGEDPASRVYVGRKHKACEEVGVYSEVVKLPEETTEEELLDILERLNQDIKINGILVQLPLPEHINTQRVLHRIMPAKDVDGFHPLNVGNLGIGQEGLVEGLVPCTPNGVIKMLDISGISIDGKHAVVIGRSNIVGKPMANLLLAKNATVTICHSRTRNLAEICRQADILVAAIGKPNFVKSEMVKGGATIIDVGINRVNGKLIGDVDFESVKDIAGAITPVPGGVGPLTIVMLLFNTLKATKMQLGLQESSEKRYKL